MAVLYQMWDVLLCVCGGEGFGLSAWEAMCSGLPVIYTHYSAHAEILARAHAGLPVGGISQPEGITCIWRTIANVAQVIEAVRLMLADRQQGARFGFHGHAFVQQYLPAIQAKTWHEIFQNKMPKCACGTMNAQNYCWLDIIFCFILWAHIKRDF